MDTSTIARIEELRARACAESGRWDEADAVFRELLKQSPDDVEALNVLGANARARGAFREAEQCFAKPWPPRQATAACART